MTNCFDFSIIIPHYNMPELLVRCLRSIPVQEDIEVIIVDDCSPDADTYRVRFPEFSRPNLQWYTTPQGGSAGRARNIGLEHAKGKWVLFIDADDYFSDNLMSVLGEYVHSEYDVIHFKEDSVDELTCKQSDRHEDRNISIDAYLTKEISAREAALWHTTVVAQIISRDYIEDNHLRFDEVLVAEDVMFAAKLACLTDNIHISDKVLYVVTTRENGLHNSVCSNVEKFVTYQQIMLQFTRYIRQYNVKHVKPCMLKVLHESYRQFGFKGFRKTLQMVVYEQALFYGFGEYLSRKINII